MVSERRLKDRRKQPPPQPPISFFPSNRFLFKKKKTSFHRRLLLVGPERAALLPPSLPLPHPYIPKGDGSPIAQNGTGLAREREGQWATTDLAHAFGKKVLSKRFLKVLLVNVYLVLAPSPLFLFLSPSRQGIPWSSKGKEGGERWDEGSVRRAPFLLKGPKLGGGGGVRRKIFFLPDLLGEGG